MQQCLLRLSDWHRFFHKLVGYWIFFFRSADLSLGSCYSCLACFAFLTKCDFHIGYKDFKTIFGLSLLRALTSFSLVIAYQNIASGVASIIHFMYPLAVAVTMAVFFREKSLL